MIDVQEGHVRLLLAQHEEHGVRQVQHLEQEVRIGDVEFFVATGRSGEVHRLTYVGEVGSFGEQVDLVKSDEVCHCVMLP